MERLRGLVWFLITARQLRDVDLRKFSPEAGLVRSSEPRSRAVWDVNPTFLLLALDRQLEEETETCGAEQRVCVVTGVHSRR